MGRRTVGEGLRVRITPLRWTLAVVVGCALLTAGCGRITVAIGDWTATCHDVGLMDCTGVAAVFVDGLDRREADYLEASGGVMAVVARPECGLGGPAWSPRWRCWEASAPVNHGRLCMVIAHDGGGAFAQVGGHDLRGAVRRTAAGWPMCR